MQAAGRASAEQLQDKYSWLNETGKPELQCADWQAEAAEQAMPDDHNPQPEEDCLDLDMEPGHLDRPEDCQEGLAVLLHPSARPDELMEQVRGLGHYQRAMARQAASPDEKTPRQRLKRASKLRKARGRQDLAKEFQAALQEAGPGCS